jgi:hypothetical protein
VGLPNAYAPPADSRIFGNNTDGINIYEIFITFPWLLVKEGARNFPDMLDKGILSCSRVPFGHNGKNYPVVVRPWSTILVSWKAFRDGMREKQKKKINAER